MVQNETEQNKATKSNAAIRDEIRESPAIVQNIGGAFLVYILKQEKCTKLEENNHETTKRSNYKLLA